MIYEIEPTVLKGSVRIPSSKSLIHRSFICASLADGESVIKNITFNRDIRATISALQILGANIKIEGNSAIVKGGIKQQKKLITFDCDESGSTLRFIIPIALAIGGSFHFMGRGKLGIRPLDVFFDIFDNQGIEYKNQSNDSKLDLFIKGKLKGGTFCVRGDISSQFITGLLFALSLTKEGGKIEIMDRLESASYLDLTINEMEKFSVFTERNEKTFVIKPNQKYVSCNREIEGDYSQAAFFFVANYLGSKIDVKGLNVDSKQGDRLILDMLAELSSNKEYREFDASDCPDIIPIFALACALTKGTTLIKNAGRLRIKESDRLNATAVELNKLGAKIVEGIDYLIIEGVESLNGGVLVEAHAEHRMAMMLAIAGCICKNSIRINGVEHVDKSYPSFFEDLNNLGGSFHEWCMG